MSGKTVTRADLSEAVYQQVGLSRTESAALVETVLSVLTPDQRPKLVAHIKAQEAMMMD